MNALLKSLGGLLIAVALWLVVAMPAQAGYGNHAERATVNIMTRVELAKRSLLVTVSQFDVVEARGGLPTP